MRELLLFDPPNNLPQVAGYYSQLAGLLAGFSFAGLTALLTMQRRSNRAGRQPLRSIAPLLGAFVGLVASSLDFALLSGEPQGTSRVASLQTTAGLGFSVAGIMLFYSMLALMADLQQDDTWANDIGSESVELLRNILVWVLPPLVVLLMWAGVADHLHQNHQESSPFHQWLDWYSASVLTSVAILALTIRKVRSIKRQAGTASVRVITQLAIGLALISLIGAAAQITLTSSDHHISDAVPAVSLTAVAAFSLLSSWSAGGYPTYRAQGVKTAPPAASAESIATAMRQAEQQPADRIRAGILEPLDTDTLVRRSIEIFPQGYLMIISIIQGVALAAIVSESTRYISSISPTAMAPALAQSALNLAGLIIVSYEYLWFTTIARWAPTFRDTAIPFALGVAEIVPAYLLQRPVAWWIAFATFALTGASPQPRAMDHVHDRGSHRGGRCVSDDLLQREGSE
ncbi:hypothetical protein Dvina_07715 [Dactylosporangium vinaceum]|uniref:Integral membrane protein n=1 Tax=Dactylosporangium vinaceum TaxID=53362 RepID=A0ABV5M7A7_9ACTN|nr:hypothetical protein [Dactylosporangium vinaceum]UAB97985.1 hypothetical protein Dvina_07715 [Dactylosporangium vinaceum]